MRGSQLQPGHRAMYKGIRVTVMEKNGHDMDRTHIPVRGPGRHNPFYAFIPRSRADEMLTPVEDD